jgi:hypothetical protein
MPVCEGLSPAWAVRVSFDSGHHMLTLPDSGQRASSIAIIPQRSCSRVFHKICVSHNLLVVSGDGGADAAPPAL